MLYNSLWTSLTCLFAFSFEKDIMNESLRVPQLYKLGQERHYFSYRIFWKWVALSIYHGIIIFFGCNFGFRGIITTDGKTDGLWFASTTAFSCIIHLVTMKLVVEIIFLNWIVILAGGVSVAFYWLFVIVFNTHAISSVFQPQLDNVYFRMFSNIQFWIAIVLLPIIALIPDATMKYYQMLYWPTISDIAIRNRRNLKDRITTDEDILDACKSNKSTVKGNG